MQNAPSTPSPHAPLGRIDILMVEEDSAEAQLCERALRQAGLDATLQVVRSAEEFRAALSSKPFHIVLAAQKLSGWNGLAALDLLQQIKRDIPFILLTTGLPDQSIVSAVQESGGDFVEKDRLVRLPLAVDRTLQNKKLRVERANLETQLQHARKMESVGRLAAGVAHDFNNILTVIQGHTGLLRSEPNLRPEMNESLQQVSRATERARKLTTQLLDLSGRHAPRLQSLDLNEILSGLSTLLQRTLGENIAVRLDCASDLPPIRADRSLIEQLILDLAVNARDMMPSGGQLVISTSTVNIEQDYLASHPDARAGRFVYLSIIDTGGGIAPDALARIFEPLGDNTTPPNRQGLAIVHSLVKQHHGWIEIQSQLGQGSTFKVFLPVGKVEASIQESPAIPIRGGAETILVVEDEAPVLWTTRDILEHYGYRVLGAASGVEALAIWHQHQSEISLLLADIVMPVGVSGQELAEQFKGQKPGLKLVYTSGYSAEAAARSLDLVDGINFLQKPYDAEKLARTVRNCLDGA